MNPMNQNQVIAVFGYNNTRIYDLIKIRKMAEQKFGAALLLVKEAINQADRDMAPYCLDHAPEDPGVVTSCVAYLREHNLELIGCLPFSDKGVIGAAYVAKEFGLFGDDCASSFAMLDKSLFRKLEADLSVSSSAYKKPFFYKTHSEAEIRQVLSSEGAFFIKPTSEGNSRGCMKIGSQADLDQWLKENPAAPQAGVICEELLASSEEYSFDGVDGCYWITKKFTTTGAYRAEYQQIVPANFDDEQSRSLHEVLELLLGKLGSNGGAFHHEFFLLKDGRIASVEPNRRPAGMWIWDLAEWAFEGFDPWSRWVDRCSGKPRQEKTLQRQNYAGIRAVISRHNGILKKADLAAVEAELKEKFGEGKFRLSILKPPGSAIRSEPRDNSDFLAFVALKHPDYDVLLASLDQAYEIILKHLEIQS